MAEIQHHHAATLARSESKVYNMDVEQKGQEEEKNDEKDYTRRAQWLRAAVLGTNDGLLTTASLMMGVGTFTEDVKTLILTGFASLVAGASSMAVGEFVSVSSQYDIEYAQMKRQGNTSRKDKLPNPYYAALASAAGYVVGAVVPLLGAAFVKDYMVRLGVVAGVVSLALFVFGGLTGVLGKASLVKSCLRLLIGGWIAMSLNFGLTKLANHGE